MGHMCRAAFQPIDEALSCPKAEDMLLKDKLNSWILDNFSCAPQNVFAALSGLKAYHPRFFSSLFEQRLFLFDCMKQISQTHRPPKKNVLVLLDHLCEWGCRLGELDHNKETIVQVCVENYLDGTKELLEILLKNIEKHFPKEKRPKLLNYKAPKNSKICSQKTALGGAIKAQLASYRDLRSFFYYRNSREAFIERSESLCALAELRLDHGAYDEKSLIVLRNLAKEMDDGELREKCAIFISKLEENFRADGKEVPAERSEV